MTQAWCDVCRAPQLVNTAADPHGGRSAQLLFDDLCALLDIPRYFPGPGSTPSRVFAAAAERADVAAGSMPEVGQAIATKAGLTWGPSCDNRQSRQHGTVVSREGVGVVVQAMRILADSGAPV
jgi:hypothetical protein